MSEHRSEAKVSQEQGRDELPPLKLRRRRRLLPELELPSARARRRERSLNEPVVKLAPPKPATKATALGAPAEDVAPAPEVVPPVAVVPPAAGKPEVMTVVIPAAVVKPVIPVGVMTAVIPTGVIKSDTAPTHAQEHERDAGTAADGSAADGSAQASRTPLYWRLLRLRYVHPNGWQRALLAEGAVAVALLLVLAGKASSWTLLILPVVVAALVKAHDLLVAGMRGRRDQAM